MNVLLFATQATSDHWIGLIVLATLYFLPTVIAVTRSHKNTAPIVVVNLLLGWTVIAWIVCLAWSFTHRTDKHEITFR
jgi:hypothetical protein